MAAWVAMVVLDDHHWSGRFQDLGKGEVFAASFVFEARSPKARKISQTATNHPSHLRPVIIKPVGRIFEISDSNPIRRKCGKCGRPLSPYKNKGLRRLHRAKARKTRKMRKMRTRKMRKMRLTGFNVTGFR